MSWHAFKASTCRTCMHADGNQAASLFSAVSGCLFVMCGVAMQRSVPEEHKSPVPRSSEAGSFFSFLFFFSRSALLGAFWNASFSWKRSETLHQQLLEATESVTKWKCFFLTRSLQFTGFKYVALIGNSVMFLNSWLNSCLVFLISGRTKVFLFRMDNFFWSM